ncbi:MAG TPA: hypothetical protein VFC68_01070 [Treponemataceae bacterium]|nr:hypothetical protein [Treponemataceae bacterium]
MDTLDWFNKKLVERYGMVKRARGCYLYTQKGVRLVDLWQENGRAILGWGACNSKAMQVYKNCMARGQTGSFSTDYKKRFEKAILQLVHSHPETGKAIDGLKYTKVCVSYTNYAIKDVPMWRPWLGVTNTQCFKKIDTAPAIIVTIPFSLAYSIHVIACTAEFYKTKKTELELSALVPGAFFSAAARSIHSLIHELPRRGEVDFKCFDTSLSPYFTRKGPYLLPDSKIKYKSFILHCLDCGIVINPFQNTPSLIPYGANLGDFRKLDKMPYSI